MFASPSRFSVKRLMRRSDGLDSNKAVSGPDMPVNTQSTPDNLMQPTHQAAGVAFPPLIVVPDASLSVALITALAPAALWALAKWATARRAKALR